jgi:formiminotetrahydrofolate cyclodeaminase
VKSTPINDWLESLGSKTAVPGGGAVAGLNAATAAAMVKMVFEYSTGPKFSDIESRVNAHIADFEQLIDEALNQAEEDEKAYTAVREAYSLPKENPKRAEAIQSALKGAAKPAIRVIKIVEKILTTAAHTKDYLNQNLLSDIGVAAANAKSALESAVMNIEINAGQIKDSAVKEELSEQVAKAEELIAKSDKIIQAVRAQLKEVG